jgi:hypothetical protein
LVVKAMVPYFSVPTSSAGVENDFYFMSLVLTKHRLSLRPELVEMSSMVDRNMPRIVIDDYMTPVADEPLEELIVESSSDEEDDEMESDEDDNVASSRQHRESEATDRMRQRRQAEIQRKAALHKKQTEDHLQEAHYQDEQRVLLEELIHTPIQPWSGPQSVSGLDMSVDEANSAEPFDWSAVPEEVHDEAAANALEQQRDEAAANALEQQRDEAAANALEQQRRVMQVDLDASQIPLPVETQLDLEELQDSPDENQLVTAAQALVVVAGS